MHGLPLVTFNFALDLQVEKLLSSKNFTYLRTFNSTQSPSIGEIHYGFGWKNEGWSMYCHGISRQSCENL